MTSAFREKPSVVLDEYLAEHFMFYHGLVGSSPENQPRFRDVRADIFDALKAGSPAQMCIALKLPPLWWDERLVQIFNEAVGQYKSAVVTCLLPAGESFELSEQDDPLRHPDWRVRANAARILGHLKMNEAGARMAESLKSSAADQKAAFCHIAYGLSGLRTGESRQALEAFLHDQEPWYRVDCAGALAHWPLAEVADSLMAAQLDPHALSDYTAVAIARKHRPAELLQMESDVLQEGALETVIGLLQAGQSTFTSEVLFEAGLGDCLPRVVELAARQLTPRRVRAVLALGQWVESNSTEIAKQSTNIQTRELSEHASVALSEFTPGKAAEPLVAWLKQHHEDPAAASQLRHAAWLVGDFRLAEAAPYLVPLAQPRCPARDEAVDALGAIGDPHNARPLVALAGQLVDTAARSNGQLSAHAVFEDNPEAQQYRDPIAQRIGRALNDPSSTVRAIAVTGIGQLALVNLLPEVVKLANAPDTHVWRAANSTVRRLHASQHAGAVTQALKDAAARERNGFRRQRLNSLLESLTD